MSVEAKYSIKFLIDNEVDSMGIAPVKGKHVGISVN